MLKYRLIFAFCLLLGLAGHSYGQVIYPPDLQCVEDVNANGDIILRWTNPVNACGPFVDYSIYVSSSPNGPFTLVTAITTQTQTTYTDINRLAGGNTWYYYMVSNFNCPGATQLSSDTVNNLNPTTPEIINVDVTPGGNVVFNWQPSPSPQTHGYVIYYYLPNGIAVPLDTVFGRFNTTYTDIIGDPTSQSLVYTVSAFDSCWKISSYNTRAHNTILAAGTVSTCENQLNLTWNKYINWPQGVKEYQVWVSANGAAAAMVGTSDSSVLFYNYEGFNDGDSLCVTIRAVSAADTTVVSNSNQLCLRAFIVQKPDYIYITNATVDLSNHIFVTWVIDTGAALTYYIANRSTNNVSYDPIKQIPVPNPLHPTEIMGDSVDITPDKNAYYYTITAFDECQHQYVTPFVKTINLQGDLYDYYVSHLQWNDFELQYATVTQYKLYRDFGQGYQQIASFAPGTNEFLDTLTQFVNELGTFCYRIEAVYNLALPNNILTTTLSSFSNVQCVIHRPIIYIPNAFAPAGLNNVFKPTIIYGEPKGYNMTIFSRWGGKVFETTDLNTGWDGTDHGKDAPIGGYAYLIRFTAADGVVVERKGIVLLVR